MDKGPYLTTITTSSTETQFLKTGDWLTSPNGLFRFEILDNGTYVVSKLSPAREPVWVSPDNSQVSIMPEGTGEWVSLERPKEGGYVYFAQVQSGGHLRIYRQPDQMNAQVAPVLLENSGEGANYFAVMQDDGDFCIYRGTPGHLQNTPETHQAYIWGTGAAPKHSFIKAGEYLTTGDWLVSGNGRFSATLLSNGTLCVYKGCPSNHAGAALWSSLKTGDVGAYFAIMQDDGDFCIYKGRPENHSGPVVWSAFHTAPGGQCFAWLEDNGNFSVYSGSPEARGHRLWCSMVNPMDFNIDHIFIGDPIQARIPPTPFASLGHLDARYATAGQTDIIPTIARRNLGLLASPEVVGALTVIGKFSGIAEGAATLIALIEGGDSTETVALELISSQISDLKISMLDAFAGVDRKLNALASILEWTYALGSTQPAANFITNAWGRFESTTNASEEILDGMARQLADQLVADDLESQLTAFYGGLIGPDLVNQPDLALINVFVKQTWQSAGYSDKSSVDSYGCVDHRAWATNIAMFFCKIQKILIDGITMHLWAIGRRRPDRYATLRAQYKGWLATLHQMIRHAIPPPLTVAFDPTLWTNYGEQRPSTFIITSLMADAATLTLAPPNTNALQQVVNRAVCVDMEGKYIHDRVSVGPITDWRSHSIFVVKQVPDTPPTGTVLTTPLRFVLSLGGDKYLQPQDGVGLHAEKQLNMVRSSQDAIPAEASFTLSSPNESWSDRTTFELRFSRGSVMATRQLDQIYLDEPRPVTNWNYEGALCTIPSPISGDYVHINKKATQFTFAPATFGPSTQQPDQQNPDLTTPPVSPPANLRIGMQH